MTMPVLESRYYIKEGPQLVYDGDAPVFNIRVPMKDGSTPTITSPTMTVYKGSTDVSSTYLTGSTSVSGDVVTTKTFQSLVGGDVLFVVVKATVNGVTGTICVFHLHIGKLSGR